MSEARITKPRRLFVEAMALHDKLSFSELKKILVDNSENKIDITTLYRTVEVFKKQGLVYEVDWKGERYFFLSTDEYSGPCATTAVVCENCGTMFDKKHPLPENTTSLYSEQRLKTCDNCKK